MNNACITLESEASVGVLAELWRGLENGAPWLFAVGFEGDRERPIAWSAFGVSIGGLLSLRDFGPIRNKSNKVASRTVGSQ